MSPKPRQQDSSMGLSCQQLGERGSLSMETTSRSMLGSGPNSPNPLHEEMLFECGVNSKRQRERNFVLMLLFEPKTQSAHLGIVYHMSQYTLLSSFLYYGKKLLKFVMLTIFKYKLSSVNCIYFVQQISVTFSSGKTETLFPLYTQQDFLLFQG